MAHLVNAVEMSINHPKTFEVPTPEEIAALNVGSIFKVCIEDENERNGERVWVEVLERNGDSFVVALRNDCYCHDFEYGDVIEAHADNIYSVFE